MNQKHYVGEKNTNSFGSEMIISKYVNSKDIDVFFPTYNWTAEHVYCANFTRGKVKCPYEPRFCNIGYMGDGKYSIHHPSYKTWLYMIRRCYDKNSPHYNPTYNDCTVCNEWHNFQNFAKWYEENYYEIPGEKMNLDKDILTKGNKMYSPDTCCFVPSLINNAISKTNSKRGSCPAGVRYRYNKYISSIKIKDKTIQIGTFNNIEDAFNAYKNYKENHIKSIADYYRDKIPDHLYIALYNYEIDIND